MGLIDDIYTGDFQIPENWSQPTEEYLKDSRALVKCEEKLCGLLSEESLEFFKTYQTLSDNINYTHNLENFRTGFRLGAQMMMDILKTDNNQ